MADVVGELRVYQERDAAEWLRRGRMGLAYEPGLGKTRTTLHALSQCFEADKILIVAPKRVVSQVWPQQRREWGGPAGLWRTFGADEFDLYKPDTRPADAPRDWQRKELMPRDIKATRKYLLGEIAAARVVLVSWYWLYWLAVVAGDRALFDTVIFDEIGYAQNRDTKTWMSARRFAAKAQRVLGLNGTPMMGKWESLWGQSYLLDFGETFGRTLTSFRQQFLQPTHMGPQGRVLKWGNPTPAAEADIRRRFDSLWAKVRAEDWLTMPTLVLDNVHVDIPDRAWQSASKFLRGALAQVDNATVLPANAAVGVNKAIQVCSGWVYDDTGAVHEVHQEKLDALLELLEQIEGGVLLFWQYSHERAAIVKALGKRMACVDEKDAIGRWERGEVQVLGAHPGQAAVGLNLQRGGNHQIWFTPTWSSWLWEQGVARTYRSGQEAGSVVVHRILSRHPAEAACVAACDGKVDMLKALMEIDRGKI